MTMKVPVISSLLFLLGVASLPAIERPKSLDEKKPKERAETRPDGAEEREQLRAREGKVEAEAAQENEPGALPQGGRPAGAWLGVLSKPVDETLQVHLGIEAGAVLDYVAPDSPASKMGLRQHDIILEVDGEAVGSQEELRDAIRMRKPGDKVALTVLSRGEKEESEVELSARPVAAPNAPLIVPEEGNDPGARFRDLPELPRDLENLLPGGGENLQRQLEGQWKRLEKQLRDMEENGAGLKLDFDLFRDLQKDNEKGGAFNFNFKSSSSFMFKDEKGSVEMKTTDGGKEVIVKNAEGEMLFEGPWDTEQDKASAPEDIRERIEGMNMGNRFRFRFDQLPEPDVELPEKKEPELE